MGWGLLVSAAVVGTVWPVPQSMRMSGDSLALSESFRFVASTSPASTLLTRAFTRYESVIAQYRNTHMEEATAAAALATCTVRAHSSDEELLMTTDVSYSLSLSGSGCVIDASTVFGALGGLETFVQLLNGTAALPHAAIAVEDRPDFSHRGVMVDSGRRFWPVSVLRNVIDVMSMSKMNVLHLHASDMCRWGVESKLYPELTESNVSTGNPAMDEHWLAGKGFYTADDVRGLIDYARDRGVRVVPEFDMPGHAAGLLPLYARGLRFCNAPFNGSGTPNWCTLQAGNGSAAQELLPPLIEEMAALFGGELFHIGGDETRCGGAGDFEKKAIATVESSPRNQTSIVWSEVFGHGGPGATSPKTIVQAWESPNASTLAWDHGRRSIEASPFRFYLSSKGSFPGVKGVTAAWCDLWEGREGARGNASATSLLLGGEVAMWTDAYCYINDCVRPGDGPGHASVLWNRTRDEAFGRSVGGMLWPRGFLAAGSFWNYRPELSKEAVAESVMKVHTTMVAKRGGVVCPVGCQCDNLHSCGVPYVPSS